VAIALMILACPAAPARAGLLIDPTGGTDITSEFQGYSVEDGSIYRNFAGTFNFYGAAQAGVSISSNGYLAFTSAPNSAGLRVNRSVNSLANLQGAPVIAAFYEDLAIVPGSTHVLENSVAGHYYAVTYKDITAADGYIQPAHSRDPAFGSDFQVTLFTGDTIAAGYHFQAGDIAISYGTMKASLVYQYETNDLAGYTGGMATVGVAKDLNSFTGVPTDSRGIITDISTLPDAPESFYLYRPNANFTAYTASAVIVAHPVANPEPASLTMLVIGLVPLAVACRRYRAGRVADA